MRRVRHRMESAGYQNLEEYLDALQVNADEFDALFNTILINVTAFFRNPALDPPRTAQHPCRAMW